MNTHMLSAGVALVLGIALTGCGAEREEPFNPSEPEEFRESVSVDFIDDGDESDEFAEVPVTDTGSRRVVIIRDEDDFETLIDHYTYADEVVNTPDFEEGQAVLIDSGWFDNSVCEQRVRLNRVQAYHITEDERIGELALRYDREEADEEAECPDERPLREWEFHYVETRADLTVVEQVEGINEDNDGSDSSDSSSASSEGVNSSNGL